MSRTPARDHLLLTGATGLLGRYLMRDLLAAGRVHGGTGLAVLVRDGKHAAAAARVEAALHRFEVERGTALPRPVVLAGSLTEPGLGLSDADREFVARRVDAVLHSAASLTFQTAPARDDDLPDDRREPFATNVGGTRNLLELCEAAGVRTFHHVSTAYVCGKRTGPIPETAADPSHGFGNDYERTKFEAERLVRTAVDDGTLDTATVLRPSIIVGDSATGFTSTYHGLYAPLRVLAGFGVKTAVSGDGRPPAENLVGFLGLDGDERKNLIPVDWASAVATRVVLDPALHGATYHLTNPHPVTVTDVSDAVGLALADGEENRVAKSGGDDLLDAFASHMETYRPYLRDDPPFDATRTAAAAPDLPCPRLDVDALTDLCRWAVRHDFAAADDPTTAANPAFAVERPGRSAASGTLRDPRLSVTATGPGGGCFTASFDDDDATRGTDAAADLHLRGTAAALAAVADGRADWDDTLASGRVLLSGPAEAIERWSDRVPAVLARLRVRGTHTPRTAAAVRRPHSKQLTQLPAVLDGGGRPRTRPAARGAAR